MLFISLSSLLFGILGIVLVNPKASLKDDFLRLNMMSKEANSLDAVHFADLHKPSLYQYMQSVFQPLLAMLGRGAWLKIGIYLGLLMAICGYLNYVLLQINSLWLMLVVLILGMLFGWHWLLQQRRQVFEATFPDALNMMMSAVTAGESITQSIGYVGNNLDNSIGQEFRQMAEYLQLGGPPDQVFQRACKNVPYPAFLFFIVTIRANMARGGQLKHVMARLIRILVDARTLEKKKMAMTSEARLSAKIVAAIPLLFMFILNYVNPGDVQFILTDPSGRLILYYVLGSESLGLFIVWLLVRGVR